jgi:very-short-patch-repair endonuclease
MKLSFALHEKSKYWSKNNKENPQDVSLHSSKKYWFDCDICYHSFLSTPKIVFKGHWCPYCKNQAVCGKDECKSCFEKSFASHEKAQHWSSRNLSTQPINILKGTPKKYWFKCNKCPHEFESQISGITGERNRWCKYCSNQALCNNENCNYCFEKSFASCKESNYWSSRNNKTPREVFKKSDSIKYWFKCDKCPHEFEKDCYHITSQKSGCPYCAITNGIVCGNEKCNYCFDKSFASHEKAQHWSSRNLPTQPINIKKGSEIKYWFKCYKCPHEFNVVLNSITNGQWCPYCAEPCKKLCDNEKCNYCFEKSFASHEKSQFWSIQNDKKARELCKMSGKKFWFKCEDCNQEFQTVLASITKHNTWCPYCVNKTEQKLYNFLINHYSVIRQFKEEWCENPKTNNKLPFDFCILAYKVIIELDGPQHFKQIMNWKDPKIQQDLDRYKQQQANMNGYRVIRILQEDVFYDRYDWMSEIKQTIEYLNKNDGIKNVYLCKNEEYMNF